MEIERKQTGIELTIKCTESELRHFALGLKYSSFDDEHDTEDCDCNEADCYDCAGITNYQNFKKMVMKEADVSVPQKKSPKKKSIKIS